jgi:hypothetical protein
MKRMVKRKVFLMSMAVAASLPAGAFAKGGGKMERDGYSHSRGERGVPVASPGDEIQESPEMQVSQVGSMDVSLLDKLRGMVKGLTYQPETGSDSVQDKSWKLELLQAESIRPGLTDNPRISASKPVGVALRLKF